MAQDWNAKDKTAGYSGFVTRFKVDTEFLSRYEPHQVGNTIHREYWIPAEELEEFNRHIRGLIEIIAEYHGVPDDAARDFLIQGRRTQEGIGRRNGPANTRVAVGLSGGGFAIGVGFALLVA
jgi:hypothetical protein